MAHDGRWSGRARDALTAMGDGDRPRSGTESNRARAARTGFTFTMPSEPGTVIARLDTTGPEPVGSVSRDGGQTWEDAERWPSSAGATTAPTATGGPVTLGAADGSGPRPLPTTLAEAERLYGKGSPVWEAVRWQAKQPAMEIRDVGPAAHAQPDPAPGQVWLPPPGDYTPGQLDADGTLTIDVADGDTLRFGGRQANARIGTKALRNGGGWTCIGIATPHGRVMVGDGWRRAPGHEFTVTAIASEDGEPWVKVRYAGGQQDLDFDARNLWDCDGYQRTRYAPARAGERYRHRAEGRTVQIWQPDRSPMLLREEDGWALYALPTGGRLDPAQWERLDGGAGQRSDDATRAFLRLHDDAPAALPALTRGGWRAEVRSNAITPGDNGARFVMHVTSPRGRTFAGPFDQWNVVVPGAKPQSAAELADFLGFCMAGVASEGHAPRDGQTICIKRPEAVVEAERARAVGAADAETDEALRARCQVFDRQRHLQWRAPGLDTAKGAALDAIAAGMGIERRAAVQPSGVATDALGRELAFDYGGNIKGPPSVDYDVATKTNTRIHLRAGQTFVSGKGTDLRRHTLVRTDDGEAWATEEGIIVLESYVRESCRFVGMKADLLAAAAGVALRAVSDDAAPSLDAIHAEFCAQGFGPVETLALPKRGEVTVFLPSPPDGAFERAAFLERAYAAHLPASTCFTVRWREAATVPTSEPYALLQGQPVRRRDGGRIVGATFVEDPAADALRFECRTCGKPIEYEGACSKKCADGGAPPYTYGRRPGSKITAYEHAASELAKRDRVLSVGADVLAIGAPAPSTLTLAGPARDLRALADAVGRALEATKPHSAVVAGQTYLVMRDEMLFRPEVAPAANVLVITADTKHLHALRALILAAMTGPPGVDHAGAWGKERVGVVVRREYRFEPATPPAADHSPTRYDGANGGADHWRWTVGE